MAQKEKRRWLSLENKVQVLQRLEKGENFSNIAKHFAVSRNQIRNVKLRKDIITKKWQGGGRTEGKKLKETICLYNELNDKVHIWFNETKTKKMSITGPLLQEYAKTTAAELGVTDFKASNGWLDSFKKRHNIKFSTSRKKEIESNKQGDISETPPYTSLNNYIKSEDGIDISLDFMETPNDNSNKSEEYDRNDLLSKPFNGVGYETIEECINNGSDISKSNEDSQNNADEKYRICDVNVSNSILSHKEAWEMTCKLLLYAHATDETDEMTKSLLEFQNLLWRARLKDKSRQA